MSLLELHKYYIREKEKLNIQQTNGTEKTAAVIHEYAWKDVELDKYDERWKECDDGGGFLTAVDGNVQNNVLSGEFIELM